jgi:hypothetical protein
MSKNKWTPQQIQLLDEIEAELVEKGCPKHRARLAAESELLSRMRREEQMSELADRW